MNSEIATAIANIQAANTRVQAAVFNQAELDRMREAADSELNMARGALRRAEEQLLLLARGTSA